MESSTHLIFYQRTCSVPIRDSLGQNILKPNKKRFISEVLTKKLFGMVATVKSPHDTAMFRPKIGLNQKFHASNFWYFR